MMTGTGTPFKYSTPCRSKKQRLGRIGIEEENVKACMDVSDLFLTPPFGIQLLSLENRQEEDRCCVGSSSAATRSFPSPPFSTTPSTPLQKKSHRVRRTRFGGNDNAVLQTPLAASAVLRPRVIEDSQVKSSSVLDLNRSEMKALSLPSLPDSPRSVGAFALRRRASSGSEAKRSKRVAPRVLFG
ncbi:expressed unknown protein [Seminavis robusta]|uniref:Uncharacterized protein n=1 Tax=Seminavis robusta TaxID=568900 RepID=A0A9N8H7R9_9STRA|nr:expressed unknown protein [Seminavis robusta]|eukprot:Sro74_g040660.1 n/a (185) ;mRNA; f:32842-33396